MLTSSSSGDFLNVATTVVTAFRIDISVNHTQIRKQSANSAIEQPKTGR